MGCQIFDDILSPCEFKCVVSVIVTLTKAMAWKVCGPNHGMANIFLSSKKSRPTLVPTQPYI